MVDGRQRDRVSVLFNCSYNAGWKHEDDEEQ